MERLICSTWDCSHDYRHHAVFHMCHDMVTNAVGADFPDVSLICMLLIFRLEVVLVF
jgi:hypothetical protein